jgi:hypothetical protein
VADRLRHERHVDELVPGCPECDALAPDLAAIGAALASLRGGRDSGHRDFRLSPTQAAELRQRGWRGWLRAFTAPRWAFARPLGSALTAIALVGLVASSVPGFALLDASREAIDQRSLAGGSGPNASPAGSPAPPESSLDNAFGAAGTPKVATSAEPLVTDAGVTPAPVPASVEDPRSATEPRAGSPNLIRLASLVVLLAGAVLLVGPTIARRMGGRGNRQPR